MFQGGGRQTKGSLIMEKHTRLLSRACPKTTRFALCRKPCRELWRADVPIHWGFDEVSDKVSDNGHRHSRFWDRLYLTASTVCFLGVRDPLISNGLKALNLEFVSDFEFRIFGVPLDWLSASPTSNHTRATARNSRQRTRPAIQQWRSRPGPPHPRSGPESGQLDPVRTGRPSWF
jgi:hypothetical protein